MEDMNVDRIELDAETEERMKNLWKDAVFFRSLELSAKERQVKQNDKHVKSGRDSKEDI